MECSAVLTLLRSPRPRFWIRTGRSTRTPRTAGLVPGLVERCPHFIRDLVAVSKLLIKIRFVKGRLWWMENENLMNDNLCWLIKRSRWKLPQFCNIMASCATCARSVCLLKSSWIEPGLNWSQLWAFCPGLWAAVSSQVCRIPSDTAAF